MKFKTLASTLLLSTFLVGGMATEAKAVTLNPQEYTFEETKTYYDGTEITIQMTLDGYLGAIDAAPYIGNTYGFQEGEQFLVVEAGSSFEVKIFCEEDVTKTYCDLFGMERPTDWDEIYIFDGSIGICGTWYQFLSENSRIVDVFDIPLWAQFYLNDLDTMVVTNSGFQYELVEVEPSVYACTDIPLGAFEYGILNGQWTQSTSGEYHYWGNPTPVYFSNILAVDQEGVDQLFETGTSLFQEDYSTIERTPIYYPGLLELLTAETPEVETPEVPETQAPTYSSWADVHVAFADENNLVVASLGDDYTMNITRAQIADLLVNMIEQYTGTTLSTEGSVQFNDTDSVTAQKANAAGIITGRDGNLFDGSANATRQEMAVMVHKAILKMEQTTNSILIDHSDVVYDFGDNQSIDNWATNAVYILANNNIMRGSDSGFEPKGNTTIEQSFVLNNNLFKLG